MSTIADYLLDVATIDYLRVATFDFSLYCQITAALHQKYTGWRSSKWLQYKMQRSGQGVSYGIGEQQHKPHGIIEASGSEAHILAHWFYSGWQADRHNLYATRIDLQVTTAYDDRPDYVHLHKRLRDPKQLILGSTGNTLYIGNRQSESFWRLYDKTPTDIRLEVELKGKQARQCFDAWMTTGKVAPLYNAYVRKSRVPSLIAEQHYSGLEVLDLSQFVEATDENMEAKMKWLIQLDGLVWKLANDHDTHDILMELLKRWTEYGTKG